MTPPQSKQGRLQQLLDRHNRKALETGQRLQGEFFLRLVDEFDQLDPEWTDVWLSWIYDHMYNRSVLDEQIQLPNHIRSALRLGASPREVLEVILQSHIYAGMPRMIKAMRTYRALMKDLGLLDLEESGFRGDARER